VGCGQERRRGAGLLAYTHTQGGCRDCLVVNAGLCAAQERTQNMEKLKCELALQLQLIQQQQQGGAAPGPSGHMQPGVMMPHYMPGPLPAYLAVPCLSPGLCDVSGPQRSGADSSASAQATAWAWWERAARWAWARSSVG